MHLKFVVILEKIVIFFFFDDLHIVWFICLWHVVSPFGKVKYLVARPEVYVEVVLGFEVGDKLVNVYDKPITCPHRIDQRVSQRLDRTFGSFSLCDDSHHLLVKLPHGRFVLKKDLAIFGGIKNHDIFSVFE